MSDEQEMETRERDVAFTFGDPDPGCPTCGGTGTVRTPQMTFNAGDVLSPCTCRVRVAESSAQDGLSGRVREALVWIAAGEGEADPAFWPQQAQRRAAGALASLDASLPSGDGKPFADDRDPVLGVTKALQAFFASRPSDERDRVLEMDVRAIASAAAARYRRLIPGLTWEGQPAPAPPSGETGGLEARLFAPYATSDGSDDPLRAEAERAVRAWLAVSGELPAPVRCECCDRVRPVGETWVGGPEGYDLCPVCVRALSKPGRGFDARTIRRLLTELDLGARLELIAGSLMRVDGPTLSLVLDADDVTALRGIAAAPPAGETGDDGASITKALHAATDALQVIHAEGGPDDDERGDQARHAEVMREQADDALNTIHALTGWVLDHRPEPETGDGRELTAERERGYAVRRRGGDIECRDRGGDAAAALVPQRIALAHVQAVAEFAELIDAGEDVAVARERLKEALVAACAVRVPPPFETDVTLRGGLAG